MCVYQLGVLSNCTVCMPQLYDLCTQAPSIVIAQSCTGFYINQRLIMCSVKRSYLISYFSSARTVLPYPCWCLSSFLCDVRMTYLSGFLWLCTWRVSGLQARFKQRPAGPPHSSCVSANAPLTSHRPVEWGVVEERGWFWPECGVTCMQAQLIPSADASSKHNN